MIFFLNFHQMAMIFDMKVLIWLFIQLGGQDLMIIVFRIYFIKLENAVEASFEANPALLLLHGYIRNDCVYN